MKTVPNKPKAGKRKHSTPLSLYPFAHKANKAHISLFLNLLPMLNKPNTSYIITIFISQLYALPLSYTPILR
jgi:hypothetical protein